MSAEDDLGSFNDANVHRQELSRMRMASYNEKIRRHNLEYEDKLIRQRRVQQILTRSAPMGGLGGMAFGMLQNIGHMKMDNYSRLQELNQKGIDMTSSEKKERDMLDRSTVSNKMFGKLDKSFEKYFGGDSKWNKFFGGQGKMAAAGLGAGALGGGMALGKMIIDSSPLLQQMLKLLQFGVMLVLKPIGDFFGMIFRPILITLLRKFIIPNYQKIMPMMLKMGQDIGNMLVGVLDFLTGDWLKNLNFGNILPEFTWDSVFPKAFGEEQKQNVEQSQLYWGTTSGFFKGLSNDITANVWKDWAKTTTFFSSIASDVGTWVKERWDSLTQFFSILQSDVGSWVKAKWDSFTSFIADSLGGVWDTLGRYWNNFVAFFASLGNTVGYLGNLIGIQAANGYDGMVNKPTLMLVGERGSEHVKVTPHGRSSGGGGVTVNISIDNMSGTSNDLNKLRSTILDVMQSVNVNRGR